MISDAAGRALQLISGIELCRETTPSFWQQMATRIVMDLDESGADHIPPIADLLAQMWDTLPERRQELDAPERLAQIASWHYLVGPGFGHAGGFCAKCGDRWPCETRQAADGTLAPAGREGSQP
jgi:hypothetical protein